MYSGFGRVMPLQDDKGTAYIDWSKAKIAEYIEAIKNENIRQITKLAFYRVSPKFWTAPASSSGKYHPKFSQGISGLARHTIAAAHFCERNLRATTTLTEYQKDICRAAVLLHDTCKSGVHFESEHTLFEHPILVAQLLIGENLTPAQVQLWFEICTVIASHMGIWNTIPDRDLYNTQVLARIEKAFRFFKQLPPVIEQSADAYKSVLRLPVPETQMQQIVAQSDYTSADSAIMMNMFDSQVGAWS